MNIIFINTDIYTYKYKISTTTIFYKEYHIYHQ